MSANRSEADIPGTRAEVPKIPISNMEFAAALFLPTQFRMYDALAEDDLLFGITAVGLGNSP
jgi:hypothetical protein